MPVAMATSFESKPDLTDPSKKKLPMYPKVEDMKEWNKEKVLDWIQKKHPNTLEGDDMKIFEGDPIGGRAFLALTAEQFKSYGLSLVGAVALKDLANEVNKGGELSNQTAGKDEIDPLGPPVTSKKSRQEDSFSELAAKARERRKRIREKITYINSTSDQHSNSVEPANPLPGAVAQLSNPKILHTLPFPSVFGVVPSRFENDGSAKGSWSYMGRTKFQKLLQKLKEVVENEAYTTVWLYGTQGYGKSHLLAALVCYLAAQDVRIVYIPDCWTMLENPVEYFRAAMLFAWADDITTKEEIKMLNTQKEIEEFFPGQKNVIFVVDQMNALKGSNTKRESDKRADLHDWLKRFTLGHPRVFSTSANHTDYLEQARKQSSNLVLDVHRGLNRMEMDEWWNRHSNINMSKDERSDFEDITGCIPLLLEKCVVSGKIDLTVVALRDIYDKASSFVQQVRDREEGHAGRWKWYRDYVKACIRRESIPSGYNGRPDLIDHRYFYHKPNEKGIEQGNYTCGLVRNAVGDQLLDEGENFADTGYLPSLARFIDNKSVAGFMMIEHAVLSSLRSDGLSIYQELGKSMELRVLRDPLSFNDDFTEMPVLYRPRKYNFKAIDGIILLIKDANKAKKKLMMFPLRITLAPDTHTDSRAMFFETYGNWITNLSRFDVEIQFLWITPKSGEDKIYPAGPNGQPPKHLERYIPFSKVNKRIWEDYQDAMRKLPKKKATKRKPPQETAAKEGPPKKTAAKGEPPQRRSTRLQK